MQSMNPELIRKIKSKIVEVVSAVIDKPGLKISEGNNWNALNLLADIEKLLQENYTYINELKEWIDDRHEIAKIERNIWNDRKHAKQEKNQQLKQAEAKEKRLKDEMKKQNKVIFPFKPLNFRSEPRRIKKKVEKNHKLSREDEDKLFYLGLL